MDEYHIIGKVGQRTYGNQVHKICSYWSENVTFEKILEFDCRLTLDCSKFSMQKVSESLQ